MMVDLKLNRFVTAASAKIFLDYFVCDVSNVVVVWSA